MLDDIIINKNKIYATTNQLFNFFICSVEIYRNFSLCFYNEGGSVLSEDAFKLRDNLARRLNA